MKHKVISASVVSLILTCLMAQPGPALAFCRAMGGYPSFEAQARALAAQRSAANAQSRARQTMTNNSIPSTQVMADQTSLKNLGFYKGDVDGRTGPAVESSIAKFRKANGLGEGTTLDATSREILNAGKAISKEASEGMQTWTSVDGRTMQAAMLRFDGGNVVLQRSDGVVFSVPLTKFSEITRTNLQSQALSKLNSGVPTAVAGE